MCFREVEKTQVCREDRMMSRQELTAVGDGPGAIVLLSPQAEQVGNKRGIQDHKTSFLCQKMQELPPRRVQHHILPAKATKMGTCGGGASLGPTRPPRAPRARKFTSQLELCRIVSLSLAA